MPFHDGHFSHFEHFGHYGLTQYGPEYGHHWCLWKDQEKCRSPDLSQIFFGSSLIATEWDKIVAETIHKTFVSLRHPTKARVKKK